VATVGREDGEERGLEASQPLKAAGNSTVPVVKFHYTHTQPAFFIFTCLVSLHPPPVLFKFSLCHPHFPSNKYTGQQKAVLSKNIVI